MTTDSLTLKWGTLKGWNISSELSTAALQKLWDAGPRSMSAMAQADTLEQREALLELIDAVGASGGEIWLDWDAKVVSAEEARKYITEYHKDD